ncbi:enoyl-CoA hydratase/isomerase family protein [Microbacterium ulmi]|uniref:enoyl-CoA hydratase n=1 Tax=Microbacterium ulmi TaxID=179095 RepID=A0A7Y2LZD5_9MICO|nr:enoyl-CoA hydratase/isomerase family protein [Microbacterium ulmi]NII69849.1 E-phenylitaconyl-CoA hydratase [Microbacterium ulmi]NNH03184.1 enoyl-CoA hydratase/isomerase family protein [Microbacterium ulmi]
MSLIRTSENGIAVLTIDRPEAANSLDSALRAELVRGFEWAEADPAVRVILLTATGDRVFCAGSDLNDTALDDFDYAADELFGSPPRPHFHRSLDTTKPVVCAVNGHALGGGLELALLADIRIAATSATFGFPEVKVGSMPGAGATQRLPRLVGMSAASHLLLTGERVSAEEAQRLGLVSECVAPDRLLDRAREIAEAIARNAPLSVRAVKRALLASQELPLAQGLELERQLFGLIRSTRDRAEGRAAFRERRAARFEGR